MKHVIVVGGGPSGIMAAYSAAMQGHKVTLFEKNKQMGKKLLMTGNGRCNVTNRCDIQAFLTKVNHNPKFLYSALNSFNSEDLLKLLQRYQCPTKEEDHGRMFPVSNKAMDVLYSFGEMLHEKGVEIHCEEPVISLLVDEGTCIGIKTIKADYKADVIIVCTGGNSFPNTGSTGDGYVMARRIGHTITPLFPSLVSLEVREDFIKDLQGLVLKDVCITIPKLKKKAFTGDVLCTHYGISGPIILNLSGLLDFDKNKEYIFRLDLMKDKSIEELDDYLIHLFSKNPNKKISNVLMEVFPKRLVPILLKQLHINEHIYVHSVKKEERKKIVETVKNLEITITSTRSFEEAMITKGGISCKEINPNTMESKKIQNLRFAGEILDVDACTGGYNLQIAWSTGYLAGKI
ncbi:MAG: NAD(P)/FAD-dependent oxidoreductase [Holdemanella sp.]|nr:NAD(P)/FAD-dependent oxidoreductase [Holdemanella sp.]